MERFNEGKAGQWHGMNAMVYGMIPPSAGLSSSSALVCAAAVTFAHANQIPVVKSDFAEFCARSERYIGTEGGGMDQAIAMLASKGSILLCAINSRINSEFSFCRNCQAHRIQPAESTRHSTAAWCRVRDCSLPCRSEQGSELPL